MNFCGHPLTIETPPDRVGGQTLRDQGRLGRFLQLDELLPLLCDPLDKQSLAREGDLLRASDRIYPIVDGRPHLFPCDLARVAEFLSGPDLLRRFRSLSPMEQYCAFGMLKGSTDNNNLDPEDTWYGRHLWRACRMLQDVRGTFLDVGCDDPLLSRGLLHPDVAYVGLEPSAGTSSAMRVGGLGEFLPFRDGSFDAAGFQTSLDHVFDYQLALAEARRVIRPGGRLYLATLLWTGERAQLYTDTVHFHHFRQHQIEAALTGGFDVREVHAYGWKGDSHRFGVYLSAVRT
ncbi:MAG: methyltransferase domain-containing protein [Ramlibacter sp.]|nr:methyltransferase domain-containing protein [Ramlibacter sp.]